MDIDELTEFPGAVGHLRRMTGYKLTLSLWPVIRLTLPLPPLPPRVRPPYTIGPRWYTYKRNKDATYRSQRLRRRGATLVSLYITSFRLFPPPPRGKSYCPSSSQVVLPVPYEDNQPDAWHLALTEAFRKIVVSMYGKMAKGKLPCMTNSIFNQIKIKYAPSHHRKATQSR